MNKVFLIGRFTNEPILKQNEQYKKVEFTLAVNRNKDGADFISCVAWNKTAELISQYLHKGLQTAIEGHINTSSYEKDGKKIYTTNVVVDNITFISNTTPIAGDKEKDIVKQDNDDPWKDMGNTINTDEIVLEDEFLPF